MLTLIPFLRVQATLGIGADTRAALISGINRGEAVSRTLDRMRLTGMRIRTQTAYDISNIEKARRALGPKSITAFRPFVPAGSQASPVFDHFKNFKYKITGRFNASLGGVDLPLRATFEYNDPNLTAEELRDGVKDAAQELINQLNLPFDPGEGYEHDVDSIKLTNHIESLTYNA